MNKQNIISNIQCGQDVLAGGVHNNIASTISDSKLIRDIPFSRRFRIIFKQNKEVSFVMEG